MDNFDIRQINNNYAPGIATYGIDGRTGIKGDNGTSVYFTSYNLEYGSSNENEQNELLVKINQSKVLSKYVDKPNGRDYEVGDIIIDGGGYIYSLYKINGSFALKYVSVIKNEDSSSFFKKVNDRVMINKEGLDVVSGSVNVDLIPDSDYPFRVVSVDRNSVDGNYNLLSLVAYSYMSDERKYLNIFYNKEDDSFHFETESNIVLDTSSLMVKGTDSKESFSDYYKVEPYNDPIGLLHRVYSEARYSYNSSEGSLTIEGFHNNFPNIEIVPDYIKVKILDSDYTTKTEKLYTLDHTNINNVDDYFKVDVGDTLKNVDKSKICISLIKGVEIYINPNNQ